jgi:aquaporin Z
MPQENPTEAQEAREWRKFFAEFWGTFLLVFAVACGDAASALNPSETTRLHAAISSGLVIIVATYFLGSISGAHLNPAVTFAFALRGNFPWKKTPAYVIAQLAGAVAAALTIKLTFGRLGELGATAPGPGVAPVQAFVIEAMLTTGLVNAILGTASGARNIGTNAGIAIGVYNVVAKLSAAALTGASMNPARSLGPDIIRGDFSSSWIYVLAPLLGAVIGVGFEWMLKGPPTRSGDEAAQGEEGKGGGKD